VTWLQAGVEFLKAVFGLITGLAWPVVVILIVCWFRKEIGHLIGRILKLKAFGAELEAGEQAKEALMIAGATAPEKTVEEVKRQALSNRRMIEDTSVGVNLDSLPALVRLAETDSREAVMRSWYLLARTIIGKAFDPAPVPTDQVLASAIEQLTAKGILNDRLLLSIRSLQKFHDTFRANSAYAPTNKEAKEFVIYTVGIRRDLGDKVD
jgi:hypothetical protein